MPAHDHDIAFRGFQILGRRAVHVPAAQRPADAEL
jgi:hypothetical protein